jgi:multiple sugar transport system substrate-binding protein
MIKDDLVKVAPQFTPSWYQGLNSGGVVAVPVAQWAEAIMEANAPGSAGRWRAAPLPQWEPGGQASAGYGGSATSLLRGCEHPEEAMEFALWINRDPRSVETLIKSGYGWPAAISGMSNPQLTKPSAFLGGQQTAQLFTDSSNQVPKGWVWWPTFDDTVKIPSDRFEEALGGRSTLVDALKAAERRTVEQIRTKGLRAE